VDITGMNAERRPETFGRFLAAERLDKGISLKEVSRNTRIGTDMLSLIESENHSLLPAEVFVKGFLRAYAKAVGADDEKAVHLYLDSIHLFRAASESETRIVKSRDRFWLRLFLVLGVLAGIIAITLYVEALWHRSSPPPVLVEQPIGQIEEKKPPVKGPDGEIEPATMKSADERLEAGTVAVPNPLNPEPAVISMEPEGNKVLSARSSEPEPEEKTVPPERSPAPEPVTPAVVAVPEKLRLNIRTVERTWLKIIVDHHDPVEYSLEPGEEMAFEASTGYNLLVGNATGIKLLLNDNPLPIPGKKGQVVTLQIP